MNSIPNFVESDITIINKGNAGSRSSDGKKEVTIKTIKAGLFCRWRTEMVGIYQICRWFTQESI